MTFLNPGFLWGLLLTIPVIAVYLLKVKPRVEKTNTWFLWDQILEERQSNSLFSKLRNFLSLLLMLLVVVLVSLSLSNPIFSKRDTRDVFILIDQSVSMNGMIDGEPGIEIAKEKARSIISSLGTSQRASIATVNHSVNFLTHLSSNTQELLDVIDGIEASLLPDSKAAGRAVAKMAQSQVAENIESASGELRIVFISDGCLDFELDEKLPIERVAISESQRENIGIVAADIQPKIGSADATVMVQLVNSGKEAKSVELEIFCEKTQSIEELIEINVLAGSNKPHFFTLKDAEAGHWKVRILQDDVLELDNSVSVILRPLPTVSVSIPDQNNYFFQRCVEAFSQTSGSLIIDNDSALFKIFQGSVPNDLRTDSLVFSPEGDSPLWTVNGGEITVLSPRVLQSDYPLLKHLDLNSFEFVGAKDITAPENAKVIVETETGVPLIYQVNDSDKSVIVVNLDPRQNDFFLHTGFIAITYDAAMYLSGNRERIPAVFPVGTNYFSADKEGLIIVNPSGKTIERVGGDSVALEEFGLYSLQDKKRSQLAVGLLSPAESLLTANIENSRVDAASSGYPLSFWLIILAIIILVLESTLYHRRKVD